MSIDWLLDLERSIDGGREIYACPGAGRNQWVMGKTTEELKKVAKRAADSKKLTVSIVRLIPKNDAVAGDFFLVPIKIDDPGARGEPQIQWSTVDTKEAGEMMRDVRHGPSPFFGMQVVESVNPEGT